MVSEHQSAGHNRFISYIAGEATANGVPEHGLSAAAVEGINESLELNEGDMVLLKGRMGPFVVSCFVVLIGIKHLLSTF